MLSTRAKIPPLALLILFALAAFSAPVSAQAALRLGVIDSADGSLLKGALLAAARVNDDGGIKAANGSRFRLAVVDTPPENMEIAIANMRQASVVAVIGPAEDDLVLRYLPELQALGAPVITSATGDTILLGDNSGRIFRARSPIRETTAALADHLVNALGIRALRTIQSDSAGATELIALANSLAAAGLRLSSELIAEAEPDFDAIARDLAQSNIDALAIFLPPADSARLVARLRAAGFTGAVVYNQADDPAFAAIARAEKLDGILSAATWSPALQDGRSEAFVLDYSRAFGHLPDALAAASYDATLAIADAIIGSSSPSENLASMRGIKGVQGELNPALLLRGELSSNALVTALNEYGSPKVVARYRRGQRVSIGEPLAIRETPIPPATATPAPTPTPAGYTLTIQSPVQNVRSGPGLEHEVIGQLQRGAQALVLGATPDYGWLVIDYRGRWGWLASHLVITFGNRSLLPIIQPPTTPTPLPAVIAPSQREADLVVLYAEPARLILDQATTINVNMLNQGSTAAGHFAIAATFEPGKAFAGVNAPGLAPGDQRTMQLTASLSGASGPQSVIIVADLNNEVTEGAAGEANNRDYAYRYIADRATLASGVTTYGIGDIDLDGYGVPDLRWTGADLAALGGGGLYLMSGFNTLDEAHYDAIDPNLASLRALRIEPATNPTIGIRTADGHRGVLRVTSVARGGAVSLEFRVYR